MNKIHLEKKRKHKLSDERNQDFVLILKSGVVVVVVVSDSSESIHVSANVKHESRRWKLTEVTWGFQVR